MSRVKSIVAIFGIFVVVFAFLFFSPALCYSEDEARAAVEAAEGEVLSCYEAVADAQAAGANVSDLLGVLNEAGWLLSKAKLAYSHEDFDSAVSIANECRSILDGVVGQAESLKLDAERAAYWDFMVNFVGSSVGALCVVVSGCAVWVFLKRREESRGEV